MKSILIAGAVLALAAPAVANAQAAAATLPNTFDGPTVAPMPIAAPPAPTDGAQAPDVARSETALRAVITGMQAGQVDYTAFSANLASRIRQQSAQITPLIQGFGALESVVYVGDESGAALFAVDFANAQTQWMIGFDADDKIAALLFRPAPAADEPAA